MEVFFGRTKGVVSGVSRKEAASAPLSSTELTLSGPSPSLVSVTGSAAEGLPTGTLLKSSTIGDSTNKGAVPVPSRTTSAGASFLDRSFV